MTPPPPTGHSRVNFAVLRQTDVIPTSSTVVRLGYCLYCSQIVVSTRYIKRLLTRYLKLLALFVGVKNVSDDTGEVQSLVWLYPAITERRSREKSVLNTAEEIHHNGYRRGGFH